MNTLWFVLITAVGCIGVMVLYYEAKLGDQKSHIIFLNENIAVLQDEADDLVKMIKEKDLKMNKPRAKRVYLKKPKRPPGNPRRHVPHDL